MNRKMRAKRNNAEARASRARPRKGPIGIVFTNQTSGEEVNQMLTPSGDVVPVLIDHESRTFESIPERDKMN